MTSFGAVDLAMIGPPLLVGLLILSSAAPVGLIIAQRRGPMTSLALAQAAACGLAVGQALWGSANILVTQVTGMVITLICAIVLSGLARRVRAPDIAAGAVFALAAALQLVLLARASDGAQQIQNLLAGQVLAISPKLLVGMILLAGTALMIWWLQDAIRAPPVANLVLAVVAFAAVQIVGLLVVMVVVTVPAAAARRGPQSWQPLIAFNIGALGYAVGLIASAMLAIPAGPAIVCAMIPISVLADQAIAFALPRGIRPTV